MWTACQQRWGWAGAQSAKRSRPPRRRARPQCTLRARSPTQTHQLPTMWITSRLQTVLLFIQTSIQWQRDNPTSPLKTSTTDRVWKSLAIQGGDSSNRQIYQPVFLSGVKKAREQSAPISNLQFYTHWCLIRCHLKQPRSSFLSCLLLFFFPMGKPNILNTILFI